MEPKSLSQYYDDIKSGVGRDELSLGPNAQIVDISKIGAKDKWNTLVQQKATDLKDKCRKRLIIDIYTKILPLDDEYKDRNKGVMNHDVDSMLATKDMTPTQYFTTAYQNTKAPLLEFVLRATDNIARSYIEEADEIFKKAEEDKVNPVVPDTDEVEEQIVEVEKDAEYEDFVNNLKKKTVNKIVDDISDLINDKKEGEEISFEPKQESSTVGICMNYLQKQYMESEDVDNDMMIAEAIRESTLNQMDFIFKFPNREIKLFESMIRYGNGYVINESANSKISPSGKVDKKFVDRIIKEYFKETSIEGAGFSVSKLNPSKDDLFISKIGGKPYLPKDHKYANNKAAMIIQINLSDIPKLGLLPRNGILQVWMDIDKSHKISVIYHSKISRNKNDLIMDFKYTTVSDEIIKDDSFPVHGVYGLSSNGKGLVHLDLDAGSKIIDRIINKQSGGKYKSRKALPKEIDMQIYTVVKRSNKPKGVLHLLGNPVKGGNNKQLLFELDRWVDPAEGDYRFPNNDNAVLQIFIDKGRLNKLDFSSITSNTIQL